MKCMKYSSKYEATLKILLLYLVGRVCVEERSLDLIFFIKGNFGYGSRLSTISKFASIQFIDTLMSDGYFRTF